MVTAIAVKCCNLFCSGTKCRAIFFFFFFPTVPTVSDAGSASCLTARCGLGQRGVYGRTLPLFWAKHTPAELFEQDNSQRLIGWGIKTEAICHQQLLIGGGGGARVFAVHDSAAAVSEEAARLGFFFFFFFSWRREFVLALALASLPLPHSGITSAREE